MAEKVFLQTFEDFQGLDYKSTPLTDSLKGCQQLINYQYSEGRSLRGSNGFQVAAQALGTCSGITTYRYANTTSGATQEQIIALNGQLWRLSLETLSIAKVAGSNDWGWRVRVNSATSTFRFYLTQGGVDATFGGNAYYDLGNGLAAYPVTVWDLYEQIDGLANFTCSAPTKSARVNGTQNNVTAITVDAGHGISAYDYISIWDSSRAQLVWRRVSSTGATTITVVGGTVSVLDNQIIGRGAAPAAVVAVDDTNISTNTPKSLTYSFWDPIPSHYLSTTKDRVTNAEELFGLANEDAYTQADQPPSFVNAGNSLYIFTSANNRTSSPYRPYDYHGQVYKYDGQFCYRAGLPRVPTALTPAAVDAGVAGILNGTYKYRYTRVQRDASGVEVESEPSDPVSVTVANKQVDVTIYNLQCKDIGAVVNGNQVGVTSIAIKNQFKFVKDQGLFAYIGDSTTSLWDFRRITDVTSAAGSPHITIEGATVDVSDGSNIYVANVGYNYRGGRISATTTNTSTITVSGTAAIAHHIQVGDTIYFRNSTTNKYIEVVVNAITTTSVSWDSAVYGVHDVTTGEYVVTNCRIRLYRTKAGGNTYYRVADLPNNYTQPTTVYRDNNPDVPTIPTASPYNYGLQEQYFFSEINKEHDPPPRGAIGCSHQGLLVCSRIKDNPNSVAFSQPGDLEYFPLASNYFDIPSQVSGPITGIGSDSENNLAVFKRNAYYDVSGDLSSGSFNPRAIKEGDYGVGCHASLAKVNGVLIGIGELGFLVVQGGELAIGLASDLNPAIWNSSQINLNSAVAVNDSSNRHYWVSIPSSGTISASNRASTTALAFCVDYANKNAAFAWSTDNYALWPTGGMAVSGNVRYHISKDLSDSAPVSGGFTFRQIGEKTDTTLPYWHNTIAPTYTYFSEWETLGEPSLNKEYLRLKVFSFPGPYESRANFDLAVTTYKDFQTTTPDTQVTMSFSSTSDFEAVQKLKSGKARGLAVKMVTNTGGQCPFISGLEMVVNTTYAKEDNNR